MERKKFSEDIQHLLDTKWKDKDIYSMSKEELEEFKKDVIQFRQEYNMLELSTKTLMNAAYGASANPFFYFFNPYLAADITGECRETTKFMNAKLEDLFHEVLWERKDLQEKFGYKLDESKHDWYRTRPVWVYSDTDSNYCKSSIYIQNVKEKLELTIEDLYNECIKFGSMGDTIVGHESVACPYKILNWSKERGLYFAPIKRVIRHKVSKPKFRLRTKSGKEVIVTNDHSCVVFRNGEQLTIKAKDINIETDIVVVIKHFKKISDVEYWWYEDLESVECIGNFEDEYVYDIEVDDSTHTFIANDILVHNSSYTTYGDFFKCWLPECQHLIDTDLKKTEWILKFNVEFLDKQNFEWLNEIYVPRHAKNIHNFELETISKASIYLKKKKYIKELVFNKGKFLVDHPKISGTGIEIIKSTTPRYCREILTNLTRLLLDEYDNYTKEDFTIMFNNELKNYKRIFYQKCITDIDDISNSVGVGNYKKYILNDTNKLEFGLKCPSSVKAMARFNYLAHKNNDDNLRMFSGKIKFYNIMEGSESTVFGYPMGERPKWSPPVDKKTQWQKNVLDPINRFLEVMNIPLANNDGTIQFSLF